MDRPLAYAVAAALSAHVALVVWTRPHARTESPPVEPSPATTVDISDLRSAETLPDPVGEPSKASTPTGAPVAAHVVRTVGRSHGTSITSSSTVSSSGEPTAATAGSETPKTASSEGNGKLASSGPKIPSLIGDPGKHTLVLPKGDLPTKSEIVASKLDKDVKASLDDHDREVGAGVGGPVVTAAHSAASGFKAPETGRATFEVETDGVGAVIAVRVLDVSSDKAGWEAVATTLRTTLGAQHLKVPKGAKGVLVRVLVEAIMRLPSGATQKVTVAPKDIGVGGTFDLSDIGAKPSRVVSVRIVEERRL